MNPIADLLFTRYGELYEDNTFNRHLADAKAGKVRAWTDYPTHKECEAVRKQLIIDRTLNDQIPQVMEKLNEVLGTFLYEKMATEQKVQLCNFYISKLNKLKNKKNFSYNDTYKVDNLFAELPDAKTMKRYTKAEITPDVILGYITHLVGDPAFRKKLQDLLNVAELMGRI